MTDPTLYEDYAWLAERSKAKRASNRENGARNLEARGIAFDSHNNGAHLVVKHDGLIVDYWPGTGKFIARTGGHRGRGVRNLIKLLDRRAGRTAA